MAVGMVGGEDLVDVILAGQSYGGMVITGVADRVPERIGQLVFLDAAFPENGESLAELSPALPCVTTVMITEPKKVADMLLRLASIR